MLDLNPLNFPQSTTDGVGPMNNSGAPLLLKDGDESPVVLHMCEIAMDPNTIQCLIKNNSISTNGFLQTWVLDIGLELQRIPKYLGELMNRDL